MTTKLKMMYAAESITSKYTYRVDSEVEEHMKNLANYKVLEAMLEISKFFDEKLSGSSIYVVTEFIMKFPEATYGYLLTNDIVNEDHIGLENLRVVAIYDNEVYDLNKAMTNKNDIFVRYLRIPVWSYAVNELQSGERLIVLPSPVKRAEMNFYDYFFRNEESRPYRKL